jgi:hypothetical protein
MTKVKAKGKRTTYLRGVERQRTLKPIKATPTDYLREFDPEELVLACFRYFVGRMTIATCCFAQHELTTAWPELPPRVHRTIKDELSVMFKRDDESRAAGKTYHPLGHDCDRHAWEYVLTVAALNSSRESKESYLRHFDARMLLVGAFRHHLGTGTREALDFARALAAVWLSVPEIDRNIIKRELEEAFEQDTKDVSGKLLAKYRTMGSEGMRLAWEHVYNEGVQGAP